MTTCADIQALIPPFLDGELAGDDRGEVEHHLGACAECRAELRAAEAVQRALRERLSAPPVPDTLKARLAAALDEEDARAGAETRRARWAWALPGAASLAAAAALVLFAVRAPILAGDADHAPVAQEAVRQRFRASPLVVQGTRNELSRSVAEYLRVPVEPPSFQRAGVNLLGWQPSSLRGRQAALFVYEVTGKSGTHQVNVHVLDARNLDFSGKESVRVGDRELWVDAPFGFSAVAYKARSGIGYVFTSEMQRGELIDLVTRSNILEMVNERLRR